MIEPNDLVLLHKADSIIQREALLAALREAGIEPVSAPRDMSRKMADNTIDLGLEGYSVTFDGFSVFVKHRDKAAADTVLGAFMKNVDAPDARQEESDHLRKYFFCALFSFVIPGVLHIFGLYHLVKGLEKGEKINWLKFIAGTVLYLFTGSLTALALMTLF